MRFFSGVCTSKARLDGKTAIVTGSNTGIGKITALHFFKRGARVIMACRNLEKAKVAEQGIRKECEGHDHLGELVVAHLDLNSLKSVKTCAKQLIENETRIDLLINNAGVMCCPKGTTEDGFEIQFGSNHLDGHIDFEDLNWEKRSYSPMQAYMQSKLANILFTKELARRIESTNIGDLTVYSLHPGVIHTELGRHLDNIFIPAFRWILRNVLGSCIKTAEQGAQTTLHCALDEDAGKSTGLYYSDCEVVNPSTRARNEEDARKLWDVSLKLVGLDENYDPFSG